MTEKPIDYTELQVTALNDVERVVEEALMNPEKEDENTANILAAVGNALSFGVSATDVFTQFILAIPEDLREETIERTAKKLNVPAEMVERFFTSPDF